MSRDTFFCRRFQRPVVRASASPATDCTSSRGAVPVIKSVVAVSPKFQVMSPPNRAAVAIILSDPPNALHAVVLEVPQPQFNCCPGLADGGGRRGETGVIPQPHHVAIHRLYKHPTLFDSDLRFRLPASSRSLARHGGHREFRAGWPQGIAPLGLPQIRTCTFAHTAPHIMSSLRDGSLSESALRLVPDAATVVVSWTLLWDSIYPPCFSLTLSLHD